MGEYMIRVDQKTSEAKVIDGRMRLMVDLEVQGKATGYDSATNRRYSLSLENGVIVATAINDKH